MQTRFIRFAKLAAPFSVALLALTACSGSNSSGPATTPSDNIPDTTSAIDWTGRACESPAYKNSLGTYTGELTLVDTNLDRFCRWNAEIVIAGTNATGSDDCNITGSIKTTFVEQGSQIENSPYLCAEMNQSAGYETGLSNGLDLNVASMNSFIVQLDDPPAAADANGIELIHAITLLESLTIGSGILKATTGTITRSN